MALTKLEEWSETAASNIDVGGIVLSDSTQIDALDNIEREHMSQVAKWLGDDTLASAATTDLGSVPGRYVSVTGTTTITALGTIKAGTIKYVKFAGILTFTHNATSLILPGAASITTAAGDTAIMVSEGSGNWRCLSYQRAGSPMRPTLGTPQASTSGTEIQFFFPVGVSRITVNFVAVSTNGSNPFVIQIGDSGGVEATGYVSSGGDLVGGLINPYTGSFGIGTTQTAARAHHGAITLTLENATTNTWCCTGSLTRDVDGAIYFTTGSKSLSAPLDRLLVSTTGGVSTFDAGEINVLYS